MSSSKTLRPLVQLSVVNQHRTADKLSTHMIGIMFGCWNARGMSPEAEHLHNTLSSLKGYKIEIKKNDK
jgi:hypothetical protein